jgi:hypothetical protein
MKWVLVLWISSFAHVGPVVVPGFQSVDLCRLAERDLRRQILEDPARPTKISGGCYNQQLGAK